MSQPRFAHEPRTEQEVVCLFGALLDDLDIPLRIESVQTAFPDCTVRRLDKDELCKVEFELYSSNFYLHRHPLDGCAIVVCWRDDAGNLPMPVIELAKVVAKRRPDLIACIDSSPHNRPWDEQRFFDRAAVDGATQRDIILLHRIIEFARSEYLGPKWLKNPTAVFAVGDQSHQFFKTYSTGWIRFPLSRLRTPPIKPPTLTKELFDRLNAVLPELSLTPDDANSKKKGGLLSQFFNTDMRLEHFLEVWKWFRDAKRLDLPKSPR
jgi:hypothetical protein